MHQQIVVENKIGANGNIGIEAAAKSPGDGYTILVATDAVSSNPHVYKMNIDPLRELVSFLQSAQEPLGGTAAQFARRVRDDYGKYARLVQELNIKVN